MLFKEKSLLKEFIHKRFYTLEHQQHQHEINIQKNKFLCMSNAILKETANILLTHIHTQCAEIEI